MSTLVSCMKKAKLSKQEQKFLQDSVAEKLGPGSKMTQQEATNAAIVEFIDSVSDERVALESEIKELGGYAAPSPYDSNEIIDEIITKKVEAQKVKVAAADKIKADQKKRNDTAKKKRDEAYAAAVKVKEAKAKVVALEKKAKAIKATEDAKAKADVKALIHAPTVVGTAKDKSPISEVTDLELNLRTKSITQTLKSLMASTADPMYKALIKRMLPHVPSDIEIVIVKHGDKLPAWVVKQNIKGMATGGLEISHGVISQHPKTGKTTIYLKDSSFIKHGTSEETVLHEVLHSATMELIASAFKQGPTSPTFGAVQRLRRLQNFLITRYNRREKAGILSEFETPFHKMLLGDPDELVTWGMTNLDFRSYLMGIKYKKVNAWSEMTSAIASMFGFNKSEHNTYLELMDIMNTVLDSDFRGQAALRLQMSGVTGGQVITLPQAEMPTILRQEVPPRGPNGDGSISTRKPTAVKATENGLTKSLVVGLASAKKDKVSFDKNAATISEYNTYRPTPAADNYEKVVNRFISHVKNNLLWLYNQVPANIKDRSHLWYDGARAITDRWSQKFNVSDQTVAGVLAALSPQKDWFMNVSLAERVLDTMANHQNTAWTAEMAATAKEIFSKPQYAKSVEFITGKTLAELERVDHKAMWIRLRDESHNDRGHRIVSPEGFFQEFAIKADGENKKTGWGSLNEIAKAVSVIQDPSFANIHSQMGQMHKVRNFYNNIIAPNSDGKYVTIDTHAVAAGLLKPLAGESLEVLHNFSRGAASSSVTGNKGTYALFAEAYRQAAKEVGILPREMQSITWEAVRGLYSPTYKSNNDNVSFVDGIWDRYRAGKLTLKAAREAIYEHAGGITNPDWVGHTGGLNDKRPDSSYQRELSGTGVPGQPTGTVPGRTGIGAPGDIKRRQTRGFESLRGLLLRNGRDADSKSGVYSRRTTTYDGQRRVVHKPTIATSRALKEVGASSPTFVEADAKTFHTAMESAAKNQPYAASVEIKPLSEYESGNYKMYLTEDGLTGAAMKTDGDLVSLFKDPSSELKGINYSYIALMVSQGGTKGDAFDTVLPTMYSKMGFKFVSRVAFNEEYAPPGWDYELFKNFNNGRPDVVFMVLDLENAQPYRRGDGQMFDDWDAAEAHRDAQLQPVGIDDIPPFKRSEYDPEAKTSSFKMDAPIAQELFEIEQLEIEKVSEEFRRDNRLDITSGRRVKEINAQLKELTARIQRSEIPVTEEEARANFDDISATVEKIVGTTVDERSIVRKARDFLKEYYPSWANVRSLVGRKLTTQIYAIERDEVTTFGKRLAGALSPTVLIHQAKNALIAASVIIHQNGLKLVGKQMVIDKEQLGLLPILEMIANHPMLNQKHLKIWEAYLIVKRSRRLMEAGKENFVLDEDLQAISDWVDARPNLKALFDHTQTLYAELNRKNLQLAVDSGWINNEDAFGGQFALVYTEDGTQRMTLPQDRMYPMDADLDAIARAQYGDNIDVVIETRDGWYHDDYIPFNRLDARGGQKGMQKAGRVGQVRKGVIGLKGGFGQIPVIENMTKNIAFLVQGSMKTVAMQTTIDMYAGITTEKIESGGEPSSVVTDIEAREAMKDLDINYDEMSIEDIQRWKRMMATVSPIAADTVVVYRNGRAEYHRVLDAHLLSALKSIGPEQMRGILKVIGFPTRLLSTTITKMPAFLVSNMVRELQNAFAINEKGSFNPLVSFGKGFANFARLLKKDNVDMLSMIASGSVSFNSYYKTAPDEFKAQLNKMAKNKSALRKIVESPFTTMKSFWDFYIRVAAATENANRLTVRNDYIRSEEKRLKKDGVVKGTADYIDAMNNAVAEGNYRAMDVLNFSRRGEGLLADLLIATMPFINPRIQGLDRLYRGAKENPGAMFIKAGMMTTMAAALAAWNWDENEEEMDKLKEEDKDLWYHFFVDMGGDKKEHFRIPKGFEIGQITGTLPERIIEQAKTDMPEPVWDSFKRFIHTTVGLSYPQIIKPALEVAINEDSFRNRPILSFGQQFIAPSEQYSVYTSKLIIEMAQNMPDSAPDWAKSPVKLQHIFKGYLGPMGAMALEGANDIYQNTGNAPDAPSKNLGQRYLVRNFLRGDERSSRNVTRMYSMLTEVGEIATTLNHLKKKDRSKMSAFYMSNVEKIQTRKALNKMSKKMSAKSKAVRAIMAHETMSGDEKAQRIQQLTIEKNELARIAVERYWRIFN